MIKKECRHFNISVEGINCEKMYFEHLKFPTSITRDILCSQRLDLTKISSLDKSAILCRSHQILHV